MGVGGWVCPPHSLPYTLTTTRRANKLILKSRIGTLPPCAGTLFLGFWPGGFDAWKGRWKNRKRWDRAHETQPRAWSASPEAGTRPGRRRGVGPRPAPTASHHLPRGGMGGTCDPQLEGAQARAALAATSLDPSRSSAVAPVDHRAWCAEGGCAHTARIRLRDDRGCWWARQHATSVPTTLLRGKRLPDHAWGRMERQRALVVLGFATPSRGVLAELRGAK